MKTSGLERAELDTHKAYTNQNPSDPLMDQKPHEFYWDGNAAYTPSISDNLRSQMGALTNAWSIQGGAFQEATVVTAYLTDPDYNDQRIGEITPGKHLHHNVQNYLLNSSIPHTPRSTRDDKWPVKTKVRVIMSGSEPDSPILKAKATDDWFADPNSQYLITTETAYINLDNGNLAYAPAVVAPDDDPPADEMGRAVLAAKKETFAKFDEVVGTPLRVGEFAYMTAFEILAPDKWDVIIPVAGGAAKRIYKTGKGVAKFVEFATKMGDKLGTKTDEILALGRTALSVTDSNVPIVARTRTKLVRLRRGGKLPANGERSDDVLGEVALKTCWTGKFCFVKDTSVLMANGTSKPIDQVRTGDYVLSRGKSGLATTPSRVTHTSTRVAPATLTLTFSNGEKIEATAEHPFYEEHKGFVPAGLLAVGNSVVTRAGPGLQIASIKKNTVAKNVFNLTASDSHTYFVGKSALWVHNVNCGKICYGPSANGNLSDVFAPGQGGITLTALEKPVELTFWQFSKEIMERYVSEGGEILFDLSHMDDIPGVLAGTSRPTATTSLEICYIRDNWGRFSNIVKFFRDGIQVGPPWL